MNYLFAPAILKQIVTMFMSVNTERFWEAQPYLVEFILNRERKYLPPHLKFYAYYTISEATRMMGVSAFPPPRIRLTRTWSQSRR